MKILPLLFLVFGIITIGIYFREFQKIVWGIAAIIGIIILYKYFYIQSYIYEISLERIKLKRGIIGKKIDFVELYRVRDMAVRQPFLLQFIGAMNFELDTSDKTHPRFIFQGIQYNDNWTDTFRNLVERVRKQRVHEVD